MVRWDIEVNDILNLTNANQMQCTCIVLNALKSKMIYKDDDGGRKILNGQKIWGF